MVRYRPVAAHATATSPSDPVTPVAQSAPDPRAGESLTAMLTSMPGLGPALMTTCTRQRRQGSSSSLSSHVLSMEPAGLTCQPCRGAPMQPKTSKRARLRQPQVCALLSRLSSPCKHSGQPACTAHRPGLPGYTAAAACQSGQAAGPCLRQRQVDTQVDSPERALLPAGGVLAGLRTDQAARDCRESRGGGPCTREQCPGIGRHASCLTLGAAGCPGRPKATSPWTSTPADAFAGAAPPNHPSPTLSQWVPTSR